MSDLALEFRRPFQLWIHTVSHKMTLLRSVKSDTESTRVDILLVNVQAIQLPTSMDSIRIGIEPAEATEIACSRFGVSSTRGYKLYSLMSDRFAGLVIASNMYWHEDSLDYGDPSFFAPEFKPLLGL